MEEKTMEKPEQPFFYIAGRPYLPTEPAKEGYYPESLTEEKGDSIAQQMGKDVVLEFSKTTPWDKKHVVKDKRVIERRTWSGYEAFVLEPFISVPARLDDFAKIRIDGAGKGIMYEVLDWVYLFKYTCKEPYPLYDLKREASSFVHSEEAYQWQTAFWNREKVNLIIDIPLLEDRIFSTAVDLFTPAAGKSAPSLIVNLYSHKPKLLREMHWKGYGRKPLSREIPPHNFVFNDGKDDIGRLDEILGKIEEYQKRTGHGGEYAIKAPLTLTEQAILLPITHEISRLYDKYILQEEDKRDEEDKYELLSLIDTLKDNYIEVKQACGEDPWAHYFLTEALPNARDFYKRPKSNVRESAFVHEHNTHEHFKEDFVLIEYSIQWRKGKLRKQNK